MMQPLAPEAPLTPMPKLVGHPIVGHLNSFRRDRAGMLLQIGREQPDIASMRFGFIRTVAVSSPAMAHEILTTKQDSFVKSPGMTVFLKAVLGNGLLTSERDFHSKQRKLIAPAFAHKRVASYASVMAERAERTAETLAKGPREIDASDMLMRLTLQIVGKTLFDTEVGGKDADTVDEAITTAMECTMAQLSSVVPVPPVIPTPTNLKTRRAVQRLDEILFRIIAERRAQGGDRGDLLSMLLASQYEGGGTMDDRQVRDEAMTLFLAGHETTANALAWTLYLLAKNPEARAKVEAEIDAFGKTPSYEDLPSLPYTLQALKEAMRLYPPAYLLGRRVVEDVVIGGHLVTKNTIVVINILGLHRRPDFWADPEKFEPERFAGDAEKKMARCVYMPFGGGPRICIGNHFALMEGHVLLATLLRRLRFDLASNAPIGMEPLVTLRPKGGLPMRVSVR